ncbi:MAG: arsenate reductase family protein, partial [Ligilactobacillus sp.]|nr:arsenate reductase family protein [Ligilactobacillus sp.]
TKDEAAKMMSENGKLIKRPLMVDENTVTCGFKPEVYQKTWL